MNLLDLIHQKLELFRLEQRYTRRRNRRSTFVSEAQYVDGEYIYSANSSYSAKCSAGSGGSDSETDRERENERERGTTMGSKRLSRFGEWKGRGAKGMDGGAASKRKSRVSVREVQWDGGVRA